MCNLKHQLILLTQAGLPLTPEPYQDLANQLGVDEAQVIKILTQMLQDGQIRRIAAVPNHYKLGFTANGMSVWDIAAKDTDKFGQQVASLAFVSHCYQRPRCLPQWPYNMFAMVHGSCANTVRDKVQQIADIFNILPDKFEILFSTRILKKTGMRFKQT